ncbi:MAG: hypothetical protein R2874_04000 [Desulfobacterales bacterium]
MPPMTLEKAIQFIGDDEMVEVTKNHPVAQNHLVRPRPKVVDGQGAAA